MPLYTYHCKECEHDFTDMQRIDNRDIPCEAPCPACGASEAVHRTITGMTISAGVGDFRKNVPAWMKDRLKEIKKTSGKHCTIDV